MTFNEKSLVKRCVGFTAASHFFLIGTLESVVNVGFQELMKYW